MLILVHNLWGGVTGVSAYSVMLTWSYWHFYCCILVHLVNRNVQICMLISLSYNLEKFKWQAFMINPNCIIDFREEQGSWTWGFLVAFDKVGWKNCCWTFTHMITYPYHRKHHDLGILPIWIEIFFQIFLQSNAWNRSPLTLAVRNFEENILINCSDKTWKIML